MSLTAPDRLGLASALGLSEEKQVKAIEAAALLHDMGKLAIPEYILNKPGRLPVLEFDKMKLHAGIGGDILSAIDFPYPVIPIVRHHHENWDGSGYPDGLRGTTIPLGARILSVVDCYDASNTVVWVLALYSELPNAFSRDHQNAVETVCRLIYPAIRRSSGPTVAEEGPLDHIEQLISQVERSKDWWPVGVVVTRVNMAGGPVGSDEGVWQMLRSLVRAEDSLVKIDSGSFLLLLLKGNNVKTRDVVARIQRRLASSGTEAVIEWASVDRDSSAENQAFTSLADAIHRTAMEADGRTRRTTH